MTTSFPANIVSVIPTQADTTSISKGELTDEKGGESLTNETSSESVDFAQVLAAMQTAPIETTTVELDADSTGDNLGIESSASQIELVGLDEPEEEPIAVGDALLITTQPKALTAIDGTNEIETAQPADTLGPTARGNFGLEISPAWTSLVVGSGQGRSLVTNSVEVTVDSSAVGSTPAVGIGTMASTSAPATSVAEFLPEASGADVEVNSAESHDAENPEALLDSMAETDSVADGSETEDPDQDSEQPGSPGRFASRSQTGIETLATTSMTFTQWAQQGSAPAFREVSPQSNLELTTNTAAGISSIVGNSVPVSAEISGPGQIDKTSPSSQIADHIVSATREDGPDFTRIEVTLDPPELGRVTIELSEMNDRLSVRLTVAEPSTLHSIQADLTSLAEVLRGAGLDVDTLNCNAAYDGSDRGSTRSDDQNDQSNVIWSSADTSPVEPHTATNRGVSRGLNLIA